MGASVVGRTGGKSRRLDTILSSQSWTCPAGVTYVIVRLVGGGGATWMSGTNSAGTNAGSTTGFGFTAGGGATTGTPSSSGAKAATTPPANSGRGVRSGSQFINSNGQRSANPGDDGADLRFGVAVTPGTSYPIVIGAGGTPNGGGADGADGATGRCEIEYEVDI